jgi:NH3-dependent NAD+ synthetase
MHGVQMYTHESKIGLGSNRSRDDDRARRKLSVGLKGGVDSAVAQER